MHSPLPFMHFIAAGWSAVADSPTMALPTIMEQKQGYVTAECGKAPSADFSNISGVPILPPSTAQRHPR
jgi:hypothetical protein